MDGAAAIRPRPKPPFPCAPDTGEDARGMKVTAPMPARSPLEDTSLPCGADVDFLLEQAAQGRGADWDAHQQDCVHCQAVLGEFTAMWEPVAELAAAPVAAPPGLIAAVMSQVRHLVHDVWYTLEITEIGAVRIASRIVAALARDSARTIPGVRVALGRSTNGKAAALAEKATFGHRHPHAAVGVLGRTAVVDLAVAIGYGDPAHQIAREIQRHVTASLRDQVGLRDVTVNVTIDDVIDGDGDGDR
jgi:uncharacterized alkaline shock family protein YloU